MRSAGETVLLIEGIVDRSVDGCELLQASQLPEAEHRPLASSERLVWVLGAIADPAAVLLERYGTGLAQGVSIGPEFVCHDRLWLAVPTH